MVASTATAGRTWRYRAEFPDGRTVVGEVVAVDKAAAAKQVRALGATPVRLSAMRSSGQLFARRRELSRTEVISLVRGLSDLLCAGVPLRVSLESLALRERRPVLKAALERLDQRVRTGEALSEALRTDPSRPPAILVALSEAGEVSGELGPVLRDLGQKLEAEHQTREDIKGHLAYPALIAVVTMLTLLGMAHFVLPQFDTLFQEQGVAPPPETAFVLDAAAFLRSWGHWIPVGVLVAIIALKGLARPFMYELECAALAVPLAGPTFMRLQAARYCRTLGQLLRSGYALARAEPVARGVLGSEVVRRRLGEAASSVRAGGRFADAVRRQNALPDDFTRLIELGEQTGDLPDMLIRSADLAEAEATRTIQRTSELISPLMMLILALIVLVVILFTLIGVLSLNEVVYA